MKILLLGATGYLGATLFELASKEQDLSVFGTSRFPIERTNMIKLDVTDRLSLEKAFNLLDPNVVIWSLKAGEKEDLLIGLTNLLSIIKEETKLIYISTDAFFVEGTGGHLESDPTSYLPKEAPLSTYVNSKKSGEDLIREGHPNYVILRTGPLYGKGMNEKIEQRTIRMVKQIEEKQPINAASNLYKTFVHVEDLAKAIIELSGKKFKGVLHVGPSQKESYYSFYKKRLKQLGLDATLVQPYLIGKSETLIPLDTSLNTQKASTLLKTNFRNV